MYVIDIDDVRGSYPSVWKDFASGVCLDMMMEAIMLKKQFQCLLTRFEHLRTVWFFCKYYQIDIMQKRSVRAYLVAFRVGYGCSRRTEINHISDGGFFNYKIF